VKTRNVVVRPYAYSDRERVREICRGGAQRGNPLKVYIEDEELVLPLIADYYMDYEPENCLVAEDSGRVVGYLLGCRDTRRYYRVLVTRILPKLICRIIWKTFTFQYRKIQTYRIFGWILFRAWRELPKAPLDRYPAHIHLTIDRGYRGYRVARWLVEASEKHFRGLGVRGGHAIVIEEVGKNAFSLVFGGEVLDARRATLWDHCTDKKWQFKLLVMEA
jgi:ribosomal protein S18 acetylase RimI-like enzyme